MSFRAELAIVRDAGAPRDRRVAAWRRCLGHYAPFGFADTLAHLRDRFGSLDEPAALDAAAAALEQSRRAWLTEVADFAAGRRDAKGRGQRRASPAELAGRRHPRWPGGEAAGGPAPGSPLDRPVATEFVARYGMTLWTPEPVDHRRRVRRLPAPPAAPSRWAGVPLTVGSGTVGLVLTAVVGGWLLTPPRIAWWSYWVTGAALLIVMARRAARRTAEPPTPIASAALRAEEDHDARRRRSFNCY